LPLLRHAKIGNFDARPVTNRSSAVVRREIEQFLSEPSADDIVLLHVSAIALIGSAGELFFPMNDKELADPHSTALSAKWLDEQLHASRSAHHLVLLDCSYVVEESGGRPARVDLSRHFSRPRTTVLATPPVVRLLARRAPSLTSQIVDGLKTGR
jgi:hypothetical protein